MPRNNRTVSLPTSVLWCFVLQKPNTRQQEKLFKGLSDKVEFAHWQYEEGDKTGNKHIQGVVRLARHNNMNFVQRKLFKATWIICDGSLEQNIKYCSKEKGRLGGPWTYGKAPELKQGKRNDLKEIKHKLEEGIPVNDIAQVDEHFGSWCRYPKSFKNYVNIISKPRDFKSQVWVLIGPTGCGKSWCAKQNTKNPHVMFNEKWFDGATPTSDLIWNDYTGEMPYNQFLQLLDDGPWTVEDKGSTISLAPRRIIITSNVPMSFWYDFSKVKGIYEALERRVDFHFDVLNTATAKEYYFTKEWFDQSGIPSPYPEDQEEEEETIDLGEDLEIEMDDEEGQRSSDESLCSWPDSQEEIENDTFRTQDEKPLKKRRRGDVVDLTTDSEEEYRW